MSEPIRYRGRIAQIRICLGKLLRMFLYQNDWKALPMAAIIAGLDRQSADPEPDPWKHLQVGDTVYGRGDRQGRICEIRRFQIQKRQAEDRHGNGSQPYRVRRFGVRRRSADLPTDLGLDR